MKYRLALIAMMAAVPAYAQSCFPTDAARDAARNNLDLSHTFVGRMDNGNIIEVFANKQTGKWVLMETAPNGTSCLRVGGVGYEVTDLPSGEPS